MENATLKCKCFYLANKTYFFKSSCHYKTNPVDHLQGNGKNKTLMRSILHTVYELKLDSQEIDTKGTILTNFEELT